MNTPPQSPAGLPPCGELWLGDDTHDHECLLREGHHGYHECICGDVIDDYGED